MDRHEEPFMYAANPATAEQRTPKGRGVDVAELVHKDLESRIETGKKKYGERLTTHNGRDALVDAYQEALDLIVYLRQVIYERDNSAPPKKPIGVSGRGL